MHTPDDRALHAGHAWRRAYLFALVMLGLASLWLIWELRRSAVVGQHLVNSGDRTEALAESTVANAAVSRAILVRQDSIHAAVGHGVDRINAKLDQLDRRDRAFQRAELRALARHVETVETKVDSVQRALPRVKKR